MDPGSNPRQVTFTITLNNKTKVFQIAESSLKMLLKTPPVKSTKTHIVTKCTNSNTKNVRMTHFEGYHECDQL